MSLCLMLNIWTPRWNLYKSLSLRIPLGAGDSLVGELKGKLQTLLKAFFCNLEILSGEIWGVHYLASIPYEMCEATSAWYYNCYLSEGKNLFRLHSTPTVLDNLVPVRFTCSLKFKSVSITMPKNGVEFSSGVWSPPNFIRGKLIFYDNRC